MAWIFTLSAECGERREAAEAFAEHFENLSLSFSDHTKIKCTSQAVPDGDNNWWGSISPTGINAGGHECRPDLTDTKRTSEAGFLLYEHLKTAPPFRFAIVGWEVDGFLEDSELDSADLTTFRGLVLPQALCERLDCFSAFEAFSSGYYWQPYQGETWQPYTLPIR